jgi:hypothetical protein
MFGLMASVFPFLFGGLFLLFGVAILVLAGRNERKAAESAAWPTAEGRLVESRLVESTSTDSDGMTSTSYKPTFRYTYAVGGKSYQGDRLNRGMSLAYDRGTALKIMERYPNGATVTVHYNPNAPAEAALETQARGGTVMRIIGFVLAGVGALCLLAGLGLALLGPSMRGLMGF